MDKTVSQEILGRPWESVEADILTINNKHYPCIVDYHSNFPVVKSVEVLSVDNLIQTCKIIFSGYWMSSKIVSDVGTNFVSGKSGTSATGSEYTMPCHHS